MGQEAQDFSALFINTFECLHELDSGEVKLSQTRPAV